MIKPVHRSPLCPVEMEMQHAQRLIVPLYSPSHSNISSTGLIIPAAERGVNNNKKKKLVLKLLKDGLACISNAALFFLDALPHLVGGGGGEAATWFELAFQGAT